MFAKLTDTVSLGAFAGVERHACGEEGLLAQGADALDALLVEVLDLAQFGGVGRVRATLRAVATL